MNTPHCLRVTAMFLADLRGLRKPASLAGGDFKTGVLLCDGDETLSLGDRLWAAPLSTLWR